MILEALKHADIPAMPFKGPYVAEKYYDGLGFRRDAGLDFLVMEKLQIKILGAARSWLYW